MIKLYLSKYDEEFCIKANSRVGCAHKEYPWLCWWAEPHKRELTVLFLGNHDHATSCCSQAWRGVRLASQARTTVS